MSGKTKTTRASRPRNNKKAKGTRTVPLTKSSTPIRSSQTRVERVSDRVSIIRGEDLLSSVETTTAVTTAGQILFTRLLNPITLGSTRLAAFAKLYSRYRFKKLRFEYCPTAAQTVPGQLLGYLSYDADCIDGLMEMDNDTRFQHAGAQFRVKAIKVADPSGAKSAWDIDPNEVKTPLYCTSKQSDPPRFYAMGAFILLSGSALPANTAFGYIRLSYEVEFSMPQLAPVIPNSGASSWMSTSSTTTVVFPNPKERFAGNIYVFPQANHNRVYFETPGWYRLTFTIISKNHGYFCQATFEDQEGFVIVPHYYAKNSDGDYAVTAVTVRATRPKSLLAWSPSTYADNCLGGTLDAYLIPSSYQPIGKGLGGEMKESKNEGKEIKEEEQSPPLVVRSTASSSSATTSCSTSSSTMGVSPVMVSDYYLVPKTAEMKALCKKN